MSDPETVIAATDQGVLRLTLNRPARLNAFIPAMHTALRRHLEDARDDTSIRAILLTGAGRGFCAGQDLEDPSVAGPLADLGSALEDHYNPLIHLLRSIEKPIVCAVNGAAAGAGANIALACDIVLAAKSAKFIQAFARLGLVPDAGGTLDPDTVPGRAARQGPGPDRRSNRRRYRRCLGPDLEIPAR